jgi:hypothetical protein
MNLKTKGVMGCATVVMNAKGRESVQLMGSVKGVMVVLRPRRTCAPKMKPKTKRVLISVTKTLTALGPGIAAFMATAKGMPSAKAMIRPKPPAV